MVFTPLRSIPGRRCMMLVTSSPALEQVRYPEIHITISLIKLRSRPPYDLRRPYTNVCQFNASYYET